MNLHERTVRGLNMLAIGVFALAALIYVWPLGSAMPDGMRAQLQHSTAAPAPRSDTSDARDVVNANILSSSRRAPTRRYVSPEVAAQSEFVMPTAFAPASVGTTVDSMSSSGDDRGSDSDEAPALYGIVSMNGTPRALLRLSSADASPALFGEGDKRGAYRVISIRGNTVVLGTSSGTRTLRLARSTRGDSSGIKP